MKVRTCPETRGRLRLSDLEPGIVFRFNGNYDDLAIVCDGPARNRGFIWLNNGMHGIYTESKEKFVTIANGTFVEECP